MQQLGLNNLLPVIIQWKLPPYLLNLDGYFFGWAVYKSHNYLASHIIFTTPFFSFRGLLPALAEGSF